MLMYVWAADEHVAPNRPRVVPIHLPTRPLRRLRPHLRAPGAQQDHRRPTRWAKGALVLRNRVVKLRLTKNRCPAGRRAVSPAAPLVDRHPARPHSPHLRHRGWRCLDSGRGRARRQVGRDSKRSTHRLSQDARRRRGGIATPGALTRFLDLRYHQLNGIYTRRRKRSSPTSSRCSSRSRSRSQSRSRSSKPPSCSPRNRCSTSSAGTPLARRTSSKRPTSAQCAGTTRPASGGT